MLQGFSARVKQIDSQVRISTRDLNILLNSSKFDLTLKAVTEP